MTLTVVNGDSPDVDKDIEQQVGELVHGEEEYVDVVRRALSKAVQRVEGVRGERRGHLPFVVVLWEWFWKDEKK